MKPRTVFLVGTALVATVVIIAIVSVEQRPLTTQSLQPGALEKAARNQDAAEPAAEVARTPSPQQPAVGKVRSQGPMTNAPFKADEDGQLVLDEQTRLNMEALVAQAGAADLHAAIRERTESLPAAAANQAEELVSKFVNYQNAQRQAYPPDDAPSTPEDAVRQLEGLHALREAHFGPEVASKLYGAEEAIAREMIEVMRLENDQSLTSEERLEQARELREQLPNVARIEKKNRESTAN